MSQSLMDRYDDRISGVLSCYDRMVITGTLPGVCYADGMTRYLYANGICIFDYPQFAMELRDRVRDGAASLAAEAGITIEHITKSPFARKRLSRGCSSNAASIPARCTSSRRWKPATATGLGTTREPAGRSCDRTAVNACTTISTSWMPRSG